MVTAKYFLGTHAFLRRVHDQWVILDLNRDQYLCVAGSDFDKLAPWVDGWGRAQEPDLRCSEEIPAVAVSLASQLMAKGILFERQAGTKPLRDIQISALQSTIGTRQSDASRYPPTSKSLRQTAAFFVACAVADYRLRRRSLRGTVASISERRHTRACVVPFDIDLATKRIVEFNRLRLLYPRAYVCIFDCLALLELLSRDSLFPDWIFAVTTDPFEAHCWLQHGNILLNDTLERVARFQPIMCI